MALARITFFGKDGKSTGIGGQLFLPDYLDWLPIELKMFWFLKRRFGSPEATHVLMISQDEAMLGTVPEEYPLRELTLKELKDIDNGLESTVKEFARQNGISRNPRNQ